jgi:hypothetical protein
MSSAAQGRSFKGDNLKKIKVLYFYPDEFFGSPMTVLTHIIRHLDRERFEPYLVVNSEAEGTLSLDESEVAAIKRRKLGFTFRYSPAMLYMKALVDEGFCGEPYIYNAYEQNSQWINPQTPLRQVDPEADQSVLQVSSLEGYGAPVIDLARWMVGADLTSVVGVLRNFVPERMVRATGRVMRMNIDDGDIFLGEFRKVAQNFFMRHARS